MTDDLYEQGEPEQEIDAALGAMLQNPAIWADTNQATEDAIVSAIFAEASDPATIIPFEQPAQTSGAVENDTSGDAGHDGNTVVSLDDRRRRWLGPFVAGVAACFLVFAGAGAIVALDPFGEETVEFALEGTDLAPTATAAAEVSETPLGTRIVLDVSGLPPAEPGTYYEAWMRTGPEEGVSAGTFHLRGGDGDIELWSGVTLDDYPLITVTIQPEGESASSGVVVLIGRLP